MYQQFTAFAICIQHISLIQPDKSDLRVMCGLKALSHVILINTINVKLTCTSKLSANRQYFDDILLRKSGVYHYRKVAFFFLYYHCVIWLQCLCGAAESIFYQRLWKLLIHVHQLMRQKGIFTNISFEVHINLVCNL
jgi:hypothetical protein